MGAVAGARVLVTGGAGFTGRQAVTALLKRVPPKPGGTPAVIVDIAARALGYRPSHDLKSTIATVWPEWAPAGTGAAAADGKAAL